MKTKLKSQIERIEEVQKLIRIEATDIEIAECQYKNGLMDKKLFSSVLKIALNAPGDYRKKDRAIAVKYLKKGLFDWDKSQIEISWCALIRYLEEKDKEFTMGKDIENNNICILDFSKHPKTFPQKLEKYFDNVVSYRYWSLCNRCLTAFNYRNSFLNKFQGKCYCRICSALKFKELTGERI